MGILKAGSDSPAAPQPHYKMFKFSIHRYESTFVHCVKTVTATFRSVYRDLVWNPKHLVDYTCRKKKLSIFNTMCRKYIAIFTT